MDPVTLASMLILGGYFVANRIAAGLAKKSSEAPAQKPAANANELVQERVGSGSDRKPGDDAGREARQLPEQHLRMTPKPQADPPAPETPALAVLQLVRDHTGKFRSTKKPKEVNATAAA